MRTTVKIDKRSVQRALQQRRMTAAELAERAGISYHTLWRSFRGDAITAKSARAIERALAESE